MLSKSLIITAMFWVALLPAQNNLVIISEQADEFSLYVNNILINELPQVQTETPPIMGDTCFVKILFKNDSLLPFSQKVWLTNNRQKTKNYDYTYSIITKERQHVLKFISVIPGTDTTINYNGLIKKYASDAEALEKNQMRQIEQYPEPSPCTKTINDSLLQCETKRLRDNHIELSRIKDAKWFISNHCLSIEQFQKILDAFNYNASKLDLSKFSYDYLQDKSNFPGLKKNFPYDSDKEALQTFYNQKTKP